MHQRPLSCCSTHPSIAAHCSALQLLGIKKVALMFLTTRRLAHEKLWRLWLWDAANLLPLQALPALQVGRDSAQRGGLVSCCDVPEHLLSPPLRCAPLIPFASLLHPCWHHRRACAAATRQQPTRFGSGCAATALWCRRWSMQQAWAPRSFRRSISLQYMRMRRRSTKVGLLRAAAVPPAVGGC